MTSLLKTEKCKQSASKPSHFVDMENSTERYDLDQQLDLVWFPKEDSSNFVLPGASRIRQDDAEKGFTIPTRSTAAESSTIASTDSLLSDEKTQRRLGSSIVSQSMKRSSIQDSIEKEKCKSIIEPSGKRIKEKKIKKFTSNRIRFSTLKLHGRDAECLTLVNFFNTISNNVNDNTGKSHTKTLSVAEEEEEVGKDAGEEVEMSKSNRGLMIINGYSGTGKTALAKSLARKVESKKYNGLFVSGKYDLYLRDEPYFGIIAACREICGAILLLRNKNNNRKDRNQSQKEFENDIQRDKQTADTELQSALIEKLGLDIYVLIDLIQELEEVVTFQDLMDAGLERPKEADSSSPGNQQEEQAKLHNIFRVFLRTISSYFGPLVMVLDDLQWADTGSLDLMEVLLSDSMASNFMIIGLYRSNEVGETHTLTQKLSNLREICRKNDEMHIGEIHVGNLSFDACKDVIMDLLSLDDTTETTELTTLCLNRTQGNVFYLISFIAMLEEEKLVEFNLHSHMYSWDIEKIKLATSASENVVDLMMKKMSRLPSGYCTLLSVAACLGSSFTLEKLKVVWEKFDHETASTTFIDDVVLTAIDEGFIESQDHGQTQNEPKNTLKSYRWIHDKVQEAAFALIPPGESSSFQVQVGNILCTEMGEEELEQSLFLVMNLLNEVDLESVREDKVERIRLSELNLRAAVKSNGCSAFSSTLKYLKKGIELLPQDSWKNQYKLTLDLYSYAAEATLFLGKEDEMMEYCNSVLNREDIPNLDKFRAKLVLADYLAAIDRNPDATKLLLDALRKLGCKFPKTSLGVTLSLINSLLKVKRSLKNRTADDIAKLPTMTDVRHVQVMVFMNSLSYSTYLCGDPLAPLVLLRSLLYSDKHGLCINSPVAAAAGGLILAATGDFEGANSLGDYGLMLLAKSTSRVRQARTKYMAATFIFSWAKPYQWIMKLLLEAYDNGMTTGDIESSMFSVCVYVMAEYAAGRRLSLVLDDCKKYSKQAKEHNREIVYDFIVIFGQAFMNLMGKSDHTTRLEGEMIPDSDEFWNHIQANTSSIGFWREMKMRLSLIFEEYEEGADLFVAHGQEFGEKVPGHFIISDTIFSGGMCCMLMASGAGPTTMKKRKKYKKYAKQARSVITDWCKKGNPNVQHYKILFDAQKAVLDKNFYAAENHFQEAIARSARSGFVHDAALASELYANFLLEVRKDQQGGMYQLEKAIDFYTEWGAKKKVELLNEKHFDIIYADERPSQIHWC